MNGTIKFILEELYRMCGIPIITVKRNEKKILFPSELKYDEEDLKLSYIQYCNSDKATIIKTGDKFYAVFESMHEQYRNCQVLLGPQMISIDDNSFNKLDNQKYLLNIENKKKDFLSGVKIYFSILNHEILNEEKIEFINDNSPESSINELFKKNNEMRYIQDEGVDSIELENRLIDSILSNDRKTFNWIFIQMHKTYFARLHSNRLVSLKYKYVALVTILTRVSINNGAQSSKVYALSDSLIQKLETIGSIQECIIYSKESCLIFMKLINSYIYSEENPIIKDIYDYIDSHVREKITLEDLANYCHKHKNYLSSEFKKYTGQTIHNYINQRKVKEAIHFLLFTNLSSSQISSMLSFSDQSHFIQIFKQFENMTPNEYRKKYQSTKIL